MHHVASCRFVALAVIDAHLGMILQAGWCIIFGLFAVNNGYPVMYMSLPPADLDCLLSLGTYAVFANAIFFSEAAFFS